MQLSGVGLNFFVFGGFDRSTFVLQVCRANISFGGFINGFIINETNFGDNSISFWKI
jgi:hypothetical protein